MSVPAVVAQMIEVGRRAVAGGLVVGSGGNLSARSSDPDEVWVTATGTWLDELDPSCFSLVRIPDGEVLGGHPKPTSELPLHLHAYRARADANALIHLHPQMSVLLDAMGQSIRMVTTDHAYYVREVRRVPWIQPGTDELAIAAAEGLRGGCNCVILGHHGCSVVADTVELAYKRAANLEQAAQATYAALALGGPVPECPPEFVENVRRGLHAV